MCMEKIDNLSKEENTKAVPETIRIHRVGTMTFGLVLILSGILFLTHMVFPVLDYEFIFRLWPCIFIFLGIEVLLGNSRKNVKFTYDKGAVVLLIILTFFAMCMAGAEWIFTHQPGQWYYMN